MAGPVTVDIPGVGKVVAEGAASEATLKEILKSINDGAGGGFKKGSAKSKDDKGGDGGGKGGGMGNPLGLLTKPVGLVAGAFSKLALTSTKLISDFADVGDSMSAAANIFSGIPVLGAVMGTVATAAEKTLASYQSATASGATFGNSMVNFSNAASAAGMTMDQFAGIIAKNGQAMILLGGNTEEGSKRFASISKELRNSQVGQQLAGLGYSTAQINEGMAGYAKIIGSTGALQGKSTKEIAAGAGAYMKELDALAKITGRSRQELEAEADARAKDAQWIAMTTGMDKDQRLMMESFVSSFPKSQQAAIKDMLTTGNITSDAAVKFNAMMGGTAQEVMQMGQAIQSGRKLTQSEIDKTKNSSISEANAKRSSAEFKTMGMYVNEYGETVQGINELANQEQNGRKKAMTAQQKAEESSAATMVAFKSQLAAFSNTFQTTLVNSGILGSLMQMFTMAADLVLKYVVPLFQAVAAVLPKIVNGLVMLLQPAIEAISNMMGGSLKEGLEGFDAVLNAVFPVLDGVMRGLVFAVQGAWDGLMMLVEPLTSLGTELFGTGESLSTLSDIALFIGDVIGGAFELLGGILSIVINTITSVVQWFKEIINNSEFLTNMFKVVGDGISSVFHQFRKYLSKDGAKNILESISDMFGSLIDSILNFIPDAMGGISDDEKKARDEAREARSQTRDAEMEAAVAARDEKIQVQKAAIAQDKKAFEQKKSHIGKIEEQNKKAEAAEAKAAEVKNYNDPIALALQEATQQKSAFIKNPESSVTAGADSTKKTIVADAEQKAAAEQKAKEEAAGKKTTTSGDTATASAASPQESASSLLASLNTKLDQLIAVNKNLQDVGEKQLQVQKGFSNDMFASVG